MLDVFHTPKPYRGDVQTFSNPAPTAGTNWEAWKKPRGISFVHFLVIGGGAGGGSGVCGAVSTAAGGGGGGGAVSCSIIFPAWALPDILWVSVGQGGAGGLGSATVATAGAAGIASYVTINPFATGAVTPVNFILCQANGGNAGTNAAGATAGGAGAIGAVTAIADGPLAALGMPAWGMAATNISFGGTAGTAGGTNSAGNGLTIPVTGAFTMGGTGGGGLSGLGGSQVGGLYTVPANQGIFLPHSGGIGTGVATSSGGNGSNGYQPVKGLNYFYGGTGGSSTGSAAPPGSKGGNGGNGATGSGGGGGGGCFTGAGSTGGNGGRGGDGLIIATSW